MANAWMQMELQMRAICEGQRSKQDVVQQSLDQYRGVYQRTKENLGVLKAVSAAKDGIGDFRSILTGQHNRQ
jgi:DNA topoisomerase III